MSTLTEDFHLQPCFRTGTGSPTRRLTLSFLLASSLGLLVLILKIMLAAVYVVDCYCCCGSCSLLWQVHVLNGNGIYRRYRISLKTSDAILSKLWLHSSHRVAAPAIRVIIHSIADRPYPELGRADKLCPLICVGGA
jgi:hypothetical protein